MPEERLQRALARAGFGSRRASEDLIREGRVSVNGRVATLGDRVDPSSDVVEVDGRRASVDPDLRYLALHKPAGVTTTMRDPHAERDLGEYLPKDVRVFPVGRLDRETEGLLLLTNDGELANRLLHPRHGVEKEYLAEVEGIPTKQQIGRLRRGVDARRRPGPSRGGPFGRWGRKQGRRAVGHGGGSKARGSPDARRRGAAGTPADPCPGRAGGAGPAPTGRAARPHALGGAGPVPGRRAVARPVATSAA